jgi:hypothetical protein
VIQCLRRATIDALATAGGEVADSTAADALLD